MGKKTISYYNSERYPDPTACFALRNILQEEREEKRRKKRAAMKTKQRSRKSGTRIWSAPADRRRPA